MDRRTEKEIYLQRGMMRKLDSKRRWKARLKLGKQIPIWVMMEHRIYPPPTEKLKQAYKLYKETVMRKEVSKCPK